MCAPSSGGSAKYNEKEANASRAYTPEIEMRPKGEEVTDKEFSMYDEAREKEDKDLTIEEFKAIYTELTDAPVLLSVSYLEDPEEGAEQPKPPEGHDGNHGGDDGSDPDGNGRDDDEETDENPNDDKSPLEEILDKIHEIADAIKEFISDLIDEFMDGNSDENADEDEKSDHEKKNDEGKKGDGDKIKTDKEDAKMNGQSVGKYDNFQAKGFFKNFASNFVANMKMQAQRDWNAMRHPIENLKMQASRDWHNIRHPIISNKEKAERKIQEIKFAFHKQENPAEKWKEKEMGQQVAASLKEFKEKELDSREAIIAKITDRISSKMEKKFGVEIDKEALKEKIKEYWEKGQENKALDEKYLAMTGAADYGELQRDFADKASELREEHRAVNRNATLGEIAAMVGRDIMDDDGKLDMSKLTAFKEEGFADIEKDMNKAEHQFEKRMEEYDKYIEKYSDEDFTPSIMELKEVNDFLNRGEKLEDDAEKIHLLSDIEGSQEFLASAFEYEVRCSEDNTSILNDKIDKMETYQYEEIDNAHLLEMASACSNLGDLKTSEVTNSFQSKNAMFDVNEARQDLHDLKGEAKGDQETDKENKELKDLLRTINDVNFGFKSKLEDDKKDQTHKDD